ncbi:MAG: TetR/AcrR family transcriptional regulator [Oscillospiraceae bacterium]|nr:TetR/AcrR family transcriptional regulator [Oscillospiraceae bacterium]
MERATVCAAQLFLEHGIEDVKMTDIAERSGIGVASLYRYFGTKTAIAASAVTFLWDDLHSLFADVFDSDTFKAQSGLKQMQDLMRMYIVLYTAHKDLLRVIEEFDRMIVTEGVSDDAMRRYEKSVIDFEPVLRRAYEAGLEDGTVRDIGCIDLLYQTLGHALNTMCMKFIGGEILPSDDFSHAEQELELLIEMAVNYIKA